MHPTAQFTTARPTSSSPHSTNTGQGNHNTYQQSTPGAYSTHSRFPMSSPSLQSYRHTATPRSVFKFSYDAQQQRQQQQSHLNTCSHPCADDTSMSYFPQSQSLHGSHSSSSTAQTYNHNVLLGSDKKQHDPHTEHIESLPKSNNIPLEDDDITVNTYYTDPNLVNSAQLDINNPNNTVGPCVLYTDIPFLTRLIRCLGHVAVTNYERTKIYEIRAWPMFTSTNSVWILEGCGDITRPILFGNPTRYYPLNIPPILKDVYNYSLEQTALKWQTTVHRGILSNCHSFICDVLNTMYQLTGGVGYPFTFLGLGLQVFIHGIDINANLILLSNYSLIQRVKADFTKLYMSIIESGVGIHHKINPRSRRQLNRFEGQNTVGIWHKLVEACVFQYYTVEELYTPTTLGLFYYQDENDDTTATSTAARLKKYKRKRPHHFPPAHHLANQNVIANRLLMNIINNDHSDYNLQQLLHCDANISAIYRQILHFVNDEHTLVNFTSTQPSQFSPQGNNSEQSSVLNNSNTNPTYIATQLEMLFKAVEYTQNNNNAKTYIRNKNRNFQNYSPSHYHTRLTLPYNYIQNEMCNQITHKFYSVHANQKSDMLNPTNPPDTNLSFLSPNNYAYKTHTEDVSELFESIAPKESHQQKTETTPPSTTTQIPSDRPNNNINILYISSPNTFESKNPLITSPTVDQTQDRNKELLYKVEEYHGTNCHMSGNIDHHQIDKPGKKSHNPVHHNYHTHRKYIPSRQKPRVSYLRYKEYQTYLLSTRNNDPGNTPRRTTTTPDSLRSPTSCSESISPNSSISSTESSEYNLPFYPTSHRPARTVHPNKFRNKTPHHTHAQFVNRDGKPRSRVKPSTSRGVWVSFGRKTFTVAKRLSTLYHYTLPESLYNYHTIDANVSYTTHIPQEHRVERVAPLGARHYHSQFPLHPSQHTHPAGTGIIVNYQHVFHHASSTCSQHRAVLPTTILPPQTPSTPIKTPSQSYNPSSTYLEDMKFILANVDHLHPLLSTSFKRQSQHNQSFLSPLHDSPSSDSNHSHYPTNIGSVQFTDSSPDSYHSTLGTDHSPALITINSVIHQQRNNNTLVPLLAAYTPAQHAAMFPFSLEMLTNSLEIGGKLFDHSQNIANSTQSSAITTVYTNSNVSLDQYDTPTNYSKKQQNVTHSIQNDKHDINDSYNNHNNNASYYSIPESPQPTPQSSKYLQSGHSPTTTASIILSSALHQHHIQQLSRASSPQTHMERVKLYQLDYTTSPRKLCLQPLKSHPHDDDLSDACTDPYCDDRAAHTKHFGGLPHIPSDLFTSPSHLITITNAGYSVGNPSVDYDTFDNDGSNHESTQHSSHFNRTFSESSIQAIFSQIISQCDEYNQLNATLPLGEYTKMFASDTPSYGQQLNMCHKHSQNIPLSSPLSTSSPFTREYYYKKSFYRSKSGFYGQNSTLHTPLSTFVESVSTSSSLNHSASSDQRNDITSSVPPESSNQCNTVNNPNQVKNGLYHPFILPQPSSIDPLSLHHPFISTDSHGISVLSKTDTTQHYLHSTQHRIDSKDKSDSFTSSSSSSSSSNSLIKPQEAHMTLRLPMKSHPDRGNNSMSFSPPRKQLSRSHNKNRHNKNNNTTVNIDSLERLHKNDSDDDDEESDDDSRPSHGKNVQANYTHSHSDGGDNNIYTYHDRGMNRKYDYNIDELTSKHYTLSTPYIPTWLSCVAHVINTFCVFTGFSRKSTSQHHQQHACFYDPNYEANNTFYRIARLFYLLQHNYRIQVEEEQRVQAEFLFQQQQQEQQQQQQQQQMTPTLTPSSPRTLNSNSIVHYAEDFVNNSIINKPTLARQIIQECDEMVRGKNNNLSRTSTPNHSGSGQTGIMTTILLTLITFIPFFITIITFCHQCITKIAEFFFLLVFYTADSIGHWCGVTAPSVQTQHSSVSFTVEALAECPGDNDNTSININNYDKHSQHKTIKCSKSTYCEPKLSNELQHYHLKQKHNIFKHKHTAHASTRQTPSHSQDTLRSCSSNHNKIKHPPHSKLTSSKISQFQAKKK